MKTSRMTALLALAALALSLAGCGQRVESQGQAASAKEAVLSAKKVRLGPVVRRDFARSFRATGSLNPKEKTSLAALVDGPIEALQVDLGDKVPAGQVLFKTRPTDYQLSVQAAQAALLSAQAALAELKSWKRPEEVEILKADAQKAWAEQEQAELNRKRIESLYQKGTVSESEYDRVGAVTVAARAQLLKVQHELKIAQAGPTREQVAVAEAKVVQAQAALNQARQKLADTEVKAPYAGVITERFARLGDYLKYGQAVLELTALWVLEADMELPEAFSQSVTPGLKVEIRMEHLGLTRTGQVVAMNRKVNLKTRTFLVKVAVDNPDGRILAGTFCAGLFHLPTLRNALAVPRSAVLKDEGRASVWVDQAGRAKRAFVKTGVEDDQFVQILEGLNEGQPVVLARMGVLAEGDRIEALAQGK